MSTGRDAACERDAAFERDVLSCLPGIARFARSLTRDGPAADDLVQETFLMAYRGYHTFRTGDNAMRWMLTICRNAFLRDRERGSRFSALDDVDPNTESHDAASAHMAAEQRGESDLLDRLDIGPAVDRALRGLAEDFRVTVVLVDMEGLSYREAAVVEGVPVGTIRSRLFRARRLLQDQLYEFARDAGLRSASPPSADPVSAESLTRSAK